MKLFRNKDPVDSVPLDMNPLDFEQIVERWYDPLYRFGLSLCRDPDEALDLTQNAFCKLARHRERLRDPAKVKSWLFSVLHREFIDGVRRTLRRPTVSGDQAPEPMDERAVDAGAGMDGRLLLRLLQELDEKFRAPLALFYLEQFSYQEIADVLEIPMGTVMSRLRRAKDQLRARWDEVSALPAASPSETLIPFPREAQHG